MVDLNRTDDIRGVDRPPIVSRPPRRRYVDPIAVTPAESGLRHSITVLRNHLLLVIATVAVVVVVTVGLTAIQTPRYRASTDILVRQGNGATLVAQNGLQGAQAARPLMENELGLAMSLQVEDATKLPPGTSDAVEITADPKADILHITATAESATAAAHIANAYAAAYLDVRRQTLVDEFGATASTIDQQVARIDGELKAIAAERDAAIAAIPPRTRDTEQRIAEANARAEAARTAKEAERRRLSELADTLRLSAEVVQGGGATVISEAQPPVEPYEPAWARNLALALIIGTLLGVALAFTRQGIDTSVVTEDDLKATTGVGTLTAVPLLKRRRGETGEAGLVSVEDPGSPAAESYRTLRAGLQFLGIERPVRSLLITSSAPGEGKSTTAANLAVAVARAKQSALLIDCDLRRPRVHDYFGLPNDRGLTSVLRGSAGFADVAQQVPEVPGLMVITAGPLPADPTELLSSPAAHAALRTLLARGDTIILDTPPVMAVADALALSSLVDGVLLVAESRRTDRQQLARAVERLRHIDAPLLGSVLNRYRAPRRGRYGVYGYGQD